jgi:hypothetical protein
MWSEPPDLNGLIVTSEVILPYGIDRNIANDFVPTESVITHATWWGGYFQTDVPCDPGVPTPGFNLRFYEDAGCLPGSMIADIVITQFAEESVGCQSDLYPLFKWGTDLTVDVVPGNGYWFAAQIKDLVFPPLGGRLSSMDIVGCDSAMWDPLGIGEDFWAPIGDIFGYEIDFSQEFNGDHFEACCLPDGHCESILTGACIADGGVAQGPGSVCDPNPCTTTATRPASWGKIKALFR